MQKWLAVLLLSIFCLSFPTAVRADVQQDLHQAGVAVSIAPPQASAEALLRLPSVYALPGSPVYWLKHVVEAVQLFFTLDDQKRAQLLMNFSRERLAEGYQAIKQGKLDKATQSLSEYQDEQRQLAGVLNTLQGHNADVSVLLDRLKQQLGLQQALQQFVQPVSKSADGQRVSQLLEVQPIQVLAFNEQDEQRLLGAHQWKTATISASPSAAASASAGVGD